jgi:8-oxo-dGTP diphosphatase
MRREIREEAGIECLELSLRGTMNWPGFGAHGEDWFVFLFLVSKFSGTLLERNPEGTLEWIDVDKLHTVPLWDGDLEFLPLVFDTDSRPFHGVMPYRDGRALSWNYSRV